MNSDVGKRALLDSAGGNVNRYNVSGGRFENTIKSPKNSRALGIDPREIDRAVLKDLSIGVVVSTLFTIVENQK